MLFKAEEWIKRNVLVVKTLRCRFLSQLCHRLPAQHGIRQTDPLGTGRGSMLAAEDSPIFSKNKLALQAVSFWKTQSW